MGCDIHMWAEVKRKRQVDLHPKGLKQHLYEEDGFERVGALFTNPYHKLERYMETGEDFDAPLTEHPYRGRNYDLFAFLADVRNGYGFAGVDTGDAIKPIAEPRGIPDDASDEYREEAAQWGEDGHSHSWFTLAELKNSHWSQKMTHRAYVSPAEYPGFKKEGKPTGSYWGGGSGPLVEAEAFEKMSPEDQKAVHGVHVEWTTPISEAAGSFYTKTIPELEMLAKAAGVDEDCVRIVFFFDN